MNNMGIVGTEDGRAAHAEGLVDQAACWQGSVEKFHGTGLRDTENGSDDVVVAGYRGRSS